MRDVRTTFVVVTTLEAVPAVEAEQLIERLRDRRLHLGLLVCNKVLPQSFSDPSVGRTAELLGEHSGELAALLASRLPLDADGATRPSAEVVGRVLNEVARSFANFRLVATARGGAARGAVRRPRGDGDRPLPPRGRHGPARAARGRRRDLGRPGRGAADTTEAAPATKTGPAGPGRLQPGNRAGQPRILSPLTPSCGAGRRGMILGADRAVAPGAPMHPR